MRHMTPFPMDSFPPDDNEQWAVTRRLNEDLIKRGEELSRENKALRRQVDACRVLDAEAWATVTRVSRTMTNAEHDKYHGCLLRDDFDELIQSRMGAAPKIAKNCPYCGSTFPIEMPK